jgi:hypothetical protein
MLTDRRREWNQQRWIVRSPCKITPDESAGSSAALKNQASCIVRRPENSGQVDRPPP